MQADVFSAPLVFVALLKSFIYRNIFSRTFSVLCSLTLPFRPSRHLVFLFFYPFFRESLIIWFSPGFLVFNLFSCLFCPTIIWFSPGLVFNLFSCLFVQPLFGFRQVWSSTYLVICLFNHSPRYQRI